MNKRLLIILLIVLGIYAIAYQTEKNRTKPVITTVESKQEIVHELIDSVTTATVYNAVPAQCKKDCTHPANPRFTIDLSRPGEHRILAMERTLRKKLGLQYGDILYIEGTDYDGYWQLQDCMNKRFAGQHKIDLLVDNSIRYGKWENVKIYKVNCTEQQKSDIIEKYMLASL